MNSKLLTYFKENDIRVNSKTTILTVEMQEVLCNNALYYVKKISEKLYGKSKIANNGQFFNCKINLTLLT